SIVFSKDGKTLTTAAINKVNPPFRSEVAEWDLETKKLRSPVQEVPLHGMAAIAPDGKTVAWGIQQQDKHMVAALWDVVKKKELPLRLKDQTNHIQCFGYDGEGKTLASGSYGTVVVWNVKSGKVLTRHGETGAGWVSAVALSPKGNLVASVGAREGVFWRVILWDVRLGRKLADWPMPGPVEGLTFSPHCPHLAAP